MFTWLPATRERCSSWWFRTSECVPGSFLTLLCLLMGVAWAPTPRKGRVTLARWLVGVWLLPRAERGAEVDKMYRAAMCAQNRTPREE